MVKLNAWNRRYQQFLTQKTLLSHGKIVPTHQHLIEARNTLNKLIKQGSLFTFLDPSLHVADKPIPATTNQIEKGINTRPENSFARPSWHAHKPSRKKPYRGSATHTKKHQEAQHKNWHEQPLTSKPTHCLKTPLIAHKPKTRSSTEAQTSTGATYTTHNHGTTPTNKTNTKYPISPERADIQSGCSTREQPLEKAYCIQIVFKLIEESMEKSALDGFTPALTKLEPNIATIAPLSVHSLISGMRTFTPYLFPASTRAARS